MNAKTRICALLVVFQVATAASGHGTPIGVGVDGGTLSVSNGCNDQSSPSCSGYAPMIFVDGSADAMLDDSALPGFTITDEPGYDLEGVAAGSGLYLDVIARPVAGSIPAARRLLWHWHSDSIPENSKVAVDPADESLMLSSDFGDIILPQTGTPLPGALKIAEPTEADIAAGHNHFLTYLLGNSPPADIGAFGFFARLTSPSYSPSQPFLVILNNGLDSDTLLTAALAINNAALVAGDYNRDDVVDAADYTVWRDTLGSTTMLAADGSGNHVVDQADYGVWKMNFGQIAGGARSANVGAIVPEPGSWILIVGACFQLPRFFRGGRRPLTSATL
jgi:hypothetical protein